MSYCEDSNINKSYIVQNVESSDIFSACTEIYLTNITPCTGDTINIYSNLNVTGDISGTTFYGDGSQLSGIITTDNYVTGGVYTASTKSLYFTGTTGFTPFSIDVSALLDDTNNYVTGGTYNPSTDTISLFRNDNVTIDITGVTDTFTTGGTYDNNTSLITFVKNDNTTYTIDLSSIDVNDTFVTGSTLNGDSLTIRRNDGVDIVVTGFSQTFTGNTSGTCIGDIYVSNIHSCSPLHINPNDEGKVFFGSTSAVTIDLSNPSISIGGEDVSDNTTLQVWTSGSTQRAIRMRDKVTNSQFNFWTTTATTGENILKLDEDTSGSTVATFYGTGIIKSNFDGDGSRLYNIPITGVTNLLSELNSKTDNTDFISHTGDTTIHFTKSSINLSDLGSSAHTHTLSDITNFNVYSATTDNKIDSKVAQILFDTHSGDTNNPHQTSFGNLTSTAHTHSISEVINLQTELDSKTDNTDFISHTGDTTIHFTKSSINLSDLGNTAHTHTISDITNLQTELDSKLNVSDFNTYSGNVQTELNTKISGATNLSSEGVFAQKNGLDLEFKGITSTGGTVNISSNSSSVNLEVTFPTDQDKFVSGGTYNGGTKEINFVGNSVETTFDVDLTSLVNSVTGDTFVTGQTFSNSTYILSTTRNDGTTFNTNLSVLATDVYVVSGVYNPATGIVTYTNSSGGTFQVSGFTTGMTDSYTTAANLNGETIEFDNNIQGSNLYNVSLSPVLSGKTDLTLFNTHTGDTNNPHQTSFSGLTSTAHTHTISDITNLQAELDSKTNNTDFISHTGDTTIHYTKSSINLSDLGNTAHTHTLSEITDFNSYSGNVQTQIDGKTDLTLFNSHTGDTNNPHQTSFSNLSTTAHTHTISDVTNLQSELDSKLNISDFNVYSGSVETQIGSKTDLTLFNSHTGDTNNPHQTSFSNLTSTAHTHTLSEITDFNTYSGNVQTQLDTKIENGINSGGANEVFSGKSGTDLYFRTISGGSNTTITTIDDIIKVDVSVPVDTNTYVTGGTYSSGTLTLDRNDNNSVVVTGFTTGGGGDNFYVTGFTYDDANTFTISRNGGLGDLSATINTLTGLTVNGVLSATTYTGITLDGIDDVTTNIPASPDNTYQGELMYFDVASNQWVSNSEYGNLGDVTIWGKKGSAGTIDKGCPVYITGFDNDIHEVELANATTATTMPVIGFTAEDFDNAGVYPLITFGKISGLDTTSGSTTLNPFGETWEVNDVLYMSKSDGGLTKFRPTGTNTQIQRIAKVLKVDTTSGQLFIFNTARTAGLPNLTTDYLWLGNGNDTPQEVIRTDVGITTTGFTYNDNNTFTMTDDNGGSLSSTFNQVSGLTVNGNIEMGNSSTRQIFSTGVSEISSIQYATSGTSIQMRWDGSGDSTVLSVNNTGFATLSSTKTSFGGLSYGADYSPYYDDRSLIDLGYFNSNISGKTDLTLFNTHTGDTNNPHNTSFSNLTSTAHTHTISDVINLQTELDSKIETASNVGGAIEVFSGKSGTDLKFRTISGGTNTNVAISGDTIVINSTGGGSGEVNTASNLGGGTGLFAQKNGVDLEFKSITSTGGTVTITNDSTTVNIESTGGTGVSDANKIFSWFMNVT